MTEFIVAPRDLSDGRRRMELIDSLVQYGDRVEVEYRIPASLNRSPSYHRVVGIYYGTPGEGPRNLDRSRIAVLAESFRSNGLRTADDWSQPYTTDVRVVLIETETIIRIENVDGPVPQDEDEDEVKPESTPRGCFS